MIKLYENFNTEPIFSFIEWIKENKLELKIEHIINEDNNFYISTIEHAEIKKNQKSKILESQFGIAKTENLSLLNLISLIKGKLLIINHTIN